MTEPNRQSGENEERIIEIEIERLRPFKEHPFQVKDDIVIIQFPVLALVTMWEMNLFFTEMRKEMISGT